MASNGTNFGLWEHSEWDQGIPAEEPDTLTRQRRHSKPCAGHCKDDRESTDERWDCSQRRTQESYLLAVQQDEIDILSKANKNAPELPDVLGYDYFEARIEE